MTNLDDKVAVVTGAGSGIGRATTERLATEGARVVVADVDFDGASETVERITSEEGTAIAITVDVSDAAAVEAMVEETLDTYGRIDIAHNNAGIEGSNQPVTELDEAEWQQVIDVNLTGVWLGLKYEIPAMIESGGGAIVNTASIGGLTAVGTPAYVASKHGVIGLTRSTATQYAQKGIRVNAICPGVIDTAMIERGATDEAGTETEEIQQLVQQQPMGRMGQPEEVANTVVWLSSTEASFITGNAFPVEGGYMAL